MGDLGQPHKEETKFELRSKYYKDSSMKTLGASVFGAELTGRTAILGLAFCQGQEGHC